MAIQAEGGDLNWDHAIVTTISPNGIGTSHMDIVNGYDEVFMQLTLILILGFSKVCNVAQFERSSISRYHIRSGNTSRGGRPKWLHAIAFGNEYL